MNYNHSSADRKSVPLPPKFICARCEKPKTPDTFSNKEITAYQSKKVAGMKIDWITAKLVCRACRGDGISELLCAGPCHQYLALDAFSKAQRKKGNDEATCIRCVAWYDLQETEISTTATPGGDMAPDEIEALITDESGYAMSELDYPGGEADDDEESSVFNPSSSRSIIQAQEPILARDGWMTITERAAAESRAASSSGRLLPHQRKPENIAPTSTTASGTNRATSTNTDSGGGAYNSNKYRTRAIGNPVAKSSAWAKPINSKRNATVIAQTVRGVPGFDAETDEPDMP